MTSAMGALCARSLHIARSVRAATLLALAIGASAPLRVCAQEPDAPLYDEDEDEDDDSLTTEVVEVRARRPAPSPDAPTASARVHERPALRLIDSLQGWLARLPDVQLQTFGGPLQPARVALRGASPHQTLVTLAGLRLNTIANAAFDLSLIPVQSLSRVTVLRGAGAMRHGSGAVGGVLDLDLGALPLSRQRDAHITLSYGSFQTWSAAADGAWRPLPEFEISAGLSLRDTDGDFDFLDAQGVPHTRNNNDGLQLGGHLRAAVGELGLPRLILTHLSSQTERGAPGPSEFSDSFLRARLTNTLSATSLQGELPDLADTPIGTLHLDASIGHRFARNHYTNPSAYLGNQPLETTHTENALEPRLSLRAEHPLHTTHLALELRYEHLQRAALSADDATHDRLVYAATLTEQLRLWSGDLTLFAGLRAEADDRSTQALIPSFGVTAHLLESLRVQANLGRAWRLPAFDELHLRNEFVRGDPDLRPEDAVTADLGFAGEPLPGLTLEATAFIQRYDALIVFVPNAFYYQARNLSGASSQGLELAAAYALDDTLQADLSYTLTDATLDAPPRDPLPGRARHQLRANLGAQLGPVGGQLGLAWLSPRFLDHFGNHTAPARLMLDTSLRLDLPQAFQLLIQANNLLDVRDAVDTLQHPLPPRSFNLGLRWRPFPTEESL